METVSWASPVGVTANAAGAGGAASIEAFLSWCRKHKVLLPKCRIAVLKNTGR